MHWVYQSKKTMLRAKPAVCRRHLIWTFSDAILMRGIRSCRFHNILVCCTDIMEGSWSPQFSLFICSNFLIHHQIWSSVLMEERLEYINRRVLLLLRKIQVYREYLSIISRYALNPSKLVIVSPSLTIAWSQRPYGKPTIWLVLLENMGYVIWATVSYG